jgi:uncharacterized protein
MTITVSPHTFAPRRIALVVLAVIALTVVYAIGTTRSGGAPAAAAANTLGTASVIPAAPGPGITVSGKAAVAGTPDTLRLDLSVTAKAVTVSEALAKANVTAAAVQKSLSANGVVKKDLQTSGLNIAPEYSYSQAGQPRLTGYQVTQGISAKLRDLVRAGDVIGKAVAAGGNAIQVNGISLDLEATGALVTSARGKAFADAKTKAEQYAKVAGRSLGDVVSITENVASDPPVGVQYDRKAFAASSEASVNVPIQPGSQDVNVTVNVVFALR